MNLEIRTENGLIICEAFGCAGSEILAYLTKRNAIKTVTKNIKGKGVIEVREITDDAVINLKEGVRVYLLKGSYIKIW